MAQRHPRAVKRCQATPSLSQINDTNFVAVGGVCGGGERVSRRGPAPRPGGTAKRALPTLPSRAKLSPALKAYQRVPRKPGGNHGANE